jgi:SAM-dependent methyltransferase
MSIRLGSLAKARLPQPVQPLARRLYRGTHRLTDPVRLRQARRRFENAPDRPEWLPLEALERLQERFEAPPAYGYDPATLERRGKGRADEISRLIPQFASTRDFLELGCHDGMAAAALCRRGKQVTAVDLESSVDERALRAGVVFVQADAAQLPFPDAMFGVVYSHGTFEHIAQPAASLAEATRVLRAGGFMYLSFGPLYLSPFGFHAFHSISVPYCHLLFSPEVLADFVERRGLAPLATYVNGWSIADHRELWSTLENRLEKVECTEFRDLTGLPLIGAYPSCFKRKTDAFDNLIVSRVKVLFRKRASNPTTTRPEVTARPVRPPRSS